MNINNQNPKEVEQITKVEYVTEYEREQLLKNSSIKKSIECLIEDGVLEELVDKSTLELRASGNFAYCPHNNNNVKVYSSATGGSVIGTLYPKECYTVMSYGVSRDQIKFLNSSGQYVYGYVDSAHALWKDRFYREGNTTDMLGSNFSAKFYRVMRNTTVYSGNLQLKFVAYAGNWIICKSGYQGKSGSTQHHLMLCHGIRYNPDGGSSQKDELILNLNGWDGSSNGYVDTGITNAGSTTPRVRGNW